MSKENFELQFSWIVEAAASSQFNKQLQIQKFFIGGIAGFI